MESWKNEQTDRLCEALLTLKSKEECYAFLSDALTIKEILTISQRLEVAKLLHDKENYRLICKNIGVSTATISRVGKCYQHGPGGYRTVLSRLAEKEATGGQSHD